MHILLATPAWLPAFDYGGPIAKITQLAQSLRDRGHTITIVTADFGPRRSRTPAGDRIVEGIDAVYLRRIAAYRWLPVVPRAISWRSSRPVDVLHCFGLRDGLTIPLAWNFKNRGIPYIVEPLGMARPIRRNIFNKRAFDWAIGHRHVRHAAIVVANSRLEADEVLGEVPGANVCVRYNPVTTASADRDATFRRELCVDDNTPLAVSVGRISSKKRMDLLVDAVAMTSGVHLAIVGPDVGDGGQTQLNDALGRHPESVQRRIHVVGERWEGARDAVLASADIFVLASESENFGNAAAEAALAAVPVVVTETCGIAELVEKHNAGLVTTLDAGGIASALRALCDDGALLTRLGANASGLAGDLDPAIIAQHQETIYRNVLNTP